MADFLQISCDLLVYITGSIRGYRARYKKTPAEATDVANDVNVTHGLCRQFPASTSPTLFPMLSLDQLLRDKVFPVILFC